MLVCPIVSRFRCGFLFAMDGGKRLDVGGDLPLQLKNMILKDTAVSHGIDIGFKKQGVHKVWDVFRSFLDPRITFA